MTELSAPIPLLASHVKDGFDCGEPVLNEWLIKRALKNEGSGASRTFVVCQGNNVVGYYVLATGSVMHQQAPGKVRRNMPEPVPVMILGRLAVSKHRQSAGIGRGLLKDAILRTLAVSRQAGIRALLAHALSESAHKLYRQCGFVESPIDPMVLMITLKDAVKSIRG
ncbi:MAG: GNAT family N-acetyltransferase [gamma proteobacterium symbiont of Bathyaustriella thionipta]|nr:GNAT family N-acetyltransferase [gamma proteobacterium symbiont of Bathyaustriella thionipta]